jgi:hypothetical protein
VSGPPLAHGDMVHDGATTPVRLGQVQLAPTDKKVLCSAMCQCDKMPDVARDGKQRKQGCVSGRLQALDQLLDQLLGHRSPYKQEINYDMSQSPPAPTMDSGIATMGHRYLPGWIGKYWGTEPEHASSFKAGRGLIRRPDVVIVNDPARPPTQDNIKQIVEMKFPPDTISREQQAAYETIAGSEKKFITLRPDKCDCHAPEPESSKIPVEQLGWVTVVAGWLLFGVSRGRSPRPPIPAFLEPTWKKLSSTLS